jgi:tartrate dehydrogenase/decarboxylase/D-malate dehydrogenase
MNSPRHVHRVAVIPGDGVGPEVTEAGLTVITAAVEKAGGAELAPEVLDWGTDRYHRTGRLMPEDGVEVARRFDALYFGAVGDPAVPDYVTLWGLLLPLRQQLDLYVNLRPVKLFPGVPSPLRDKGPEQIDMLCVRENTEGEYAGVGGRAHLGLPHEVALQTDVFTRSGVERIARYAFELARMRRRCLASITKSNASPYSFALWDDVVVEVADQYPDVTVERLLVDAAAAYFVSQPERFDVVVASNLFGDILTDIGAVIQGSMGLAASANINPAADVPGLFEPVHGSAPDIAGKGIANPIGAVWAGALMLEHLGENQAASLVMDALSAVLLEGKCKTPDLGGDSRTSDVAEALVTAIHTLSGS